MKRKESKIPLILTALVLGFFVFWAMGFVRRNRTAPPLDQPIEAQAKAPTRLAPPGPTPEVVEKMDQAPAQQPVANRATTPSAEPHALFIDEDARDADTTPAQPINRKIAGMSDVATQRH